MTSAGGDEAGRQPSGMVTFLFTDVEGSTDHWASNADAMAMSLRVHDDLLRGRIESHSGYVFTTAGDSFAAAFGRASDGLDAALAVQAALSDTEWPGPTLRVRIGLHIGEAEERAGDYFGPPVNLAARVEAAAHGGQIIISDALHQIVGVGTRLGAFTLRGIPEPVVLHQVDDGEHPPPRVPRPELSSLPIPPTGLIGRDDDVSTVRQRLRSSKLVTLVGPGGSGKTRLALEVAEQELPSRPEGVYFADLCDITDERNVAGAIAIALKLVLSDGDITDQVARHLSDKNSLLVIDNCEHVVDACADLIEQLLAAGGEACLLATSREPLDLHGEQVFRVDPLDVEGVDSPGVSLFCNRATALDSSFELTDSNLSSVAQLVRELDGIPLAIELAASRISSLSPHEMLERMDDRFRLLSGGRRSRRRSKTLESTMAWSYDLLDDEERRCLRQCAAFVGSFDREALSQILGVSDLDATDLLESLVAKSLVQTVNFGDLTRFRLLETVRAYGILQLREAGELDDVQTELLRVMLERHAFVEPPLWDGRPDLADKQLESDWRNISAALDVAFKSERADDAARLFIGTWRLWWGVAPADEGFRWIDRFNSVELDRDLADRLTNVEGQLWLRIDRYTEFRVTGERLIESSDIELRVLGHGTIAFHDRANTESGSQHIAAALGLLEQVRTERGDTSFAMAEGFVLVVRAMGALFGGDLAAAAADFDSVAQVGRRDLDRALALQSLGAIHLLRGEPEKAIEKAHAAPVIYWFDSRAVIETVALCAMGEVEDARACIEEFSQVARLGRLSRQSNEALVGMAAVAKAEADDEGARQQLLASVLPRNPWSIVIARFLAEQLGIGDEMGQRMTKALADRGDMGRHDATAELNQILAAPSSA